MFIPCPICGEREISEFVVRGEALGERPTSAGGAASFHDYYFLRTNPAGPIHEHWYHVSGCLNWLVVQRDTRTHAILGVALASEG